MFKDCLTTVRKNLMVAKNVGFWWLLWYGALCVFRNNQKRLWVYVQPLIFITNRHQFFEWLFVSTSCQVHNLLCCFLHLMIDSLIVCRSRFCCCECLASTCESLALIVFRFMFFSPQSVTEKPCQTVSRLEYKRIR